MQRLTSLLALSAALACAGAPHAPAPATPESLAPAVDSASVGPAAQAGVDLSDAWATGTTDEPAVQRIRFEEQCNYTPSRWVTQQNGDTVRAWKFPEQHAQGIASPAPLVSTAPAEGRLHGVELIMTSGDDRYVLHYDTTSGHLRGTFNGAPFWAVPLDIVQPEDCIAVP